MQKEINKKGAKAAILRSQKHLWLMQKDLKCPKHGRVDSEHTKEVEFAFRELQLMLRSKEPLWCCSVCCACSYLMILLSCCCCCCGCCCCCCSCCCCCCCCSISTLYYELSELLACGLWSHFWMNRLLLYEPPLFGCRYFFLFSCRYPFSLWLSTRSLSMTETVASLFFFLIPPKQLEIENGLQFVPINHSWAREAKRRKGCGIINI